MLEEDTICLLNVGDNMLHLLVRITIVFLLLIDELIVITNAIYP